MANFLDIDESLVARNFLFGKDTSSEVEVGEPSILTPSERREQSQCKFIIPQPGLCVKTKELATGHKVFINMCKSNDVPEPDNYLNDEQLQELLSAGSDEEVKGFKIPMSVGEKHVEKDKSGTACPVFDFVINSTFFEQTVLKSELYRTFIVVLAIEAFEEKFKLELEKNDYVVLQNKKCMGKLNPHLVKSRPGIKEIMEPSLIPGMPKSSSTSSSKSLVEEIETKEHTLEYSITQVSRELAHAEIKLPNLRNAKKLNVTVGADRIIVDSPEGQLDIFVPLDIHQEKSKAEFNVAEKTLRLQLPLVIKP